MQASRDNALNLKPLERKFVDFEVDRNESPYITAYKTASGTYTEDKFITDENGEMKVEKEEKQNIFYGWENDIQTD